MTQLEIELPELAFSVLRLSPHEFAAEMRLAAAVHWYAERRSSQAEAAEIAGLSRAEPCFACAATLSAGGATCEGRARFRPSRRAPGTARCGVS